MIDRIIKVPNSQSFFLFGPRQTGKTTYLKTKYKDAFWINLLDDGIFKQLLIRPNLLLEIVRARPIDQWIIIDEVQKIPELLNLVHMLIEERKQKFILTGSSARKLKSAGVNLLAGRAIDKKFHPLTAEELGENFNLKEAILYGQLPSLIGVESKRDALSAYVGMYLKEEIQQEALVRRLDQFARFLEVAAFSQAQVLSVLSIASDLGVSRNTAESYFQILEDLLLAYRIPVFKKSILAVNLLNQPLILL
jgi:predicted AAA+ superfamily ATPase